MNAKKNNSLRFHMDNDGWDVIQKEVMDWQDSIWSSMHLPGDEYIDSTFRLVQPKTLAR